MRKVILCIATIAATASGVVAQTAARAPTGGEARLYARLLAMTDARSFDPALIDSALASAWAPLRRAAALGIGQVGSPPGIPGTARLRGLLTDADIIVASNAAYSLGLLVDSTSVAALAAALDGPRAVAREAAWALGEIGAPARDAIVAGLAKPVADEGRTIQLLLASAKLRPVPVSGLRPYLAMWNRPSVLWAATYAIARFRAPSGVRDLVALANRREFTRFSAGEAAARIGAPASVRAGGSRTADAYVLDVAGRQRARAEIARGLARPAAGDSLAQLALPVLVRLATDPHPHVRINAIRSLATYEKEVAMQVVAATEDPDANVRIAAAQALGTVLDSAVAGWAPLWGRDTTLAYRSSLLASAARAGAILPEFQSWRTHSDFRYRSAALAAAGSSVDSGVRRSAARSMLRDEDGRVRAVAYGVVAGNDTAGPPAPIREILVAGLTDRDAYARAAAIGALSARARASEVPAVLDAYALSLADSGNDARIAAVAYIAAAWTRDSTAFPSPLRRRISGLAPSDDQLVRAAAENLPLLGGWRAVKRNPRDLSWYQNIVSTLVIPALSGETQRATISTRHGDVVLELFGADAPLTVWNFMNLARTGYYEGTAFHRVVPNFVAQDGDPRGDGNGGPGYAIRDEMNPRRYERGALGMALSGPDTGGSQYFITHSPQPHLDGHYTVFGRVLNGYGALDSIIQGDPVVSVTVR
ncbi:MAG: peptidylprolyl isomerase [Gemmatimonadaceae bacterium]